MTSKTSKPRRAVLVSLDLGDQGFRLRLDDVVIEDIQENVWRQAEVYTWKDIEEESLDNLDFEEKELADFGYSILARLYAFKKRGEL